MQKIKPQILIAISFYLLANSPIAHGQSRPYDLIEQDLRSFIPESNPLGFSLKIKAISRNEYRFWRGTKYLFMKWASQNCQDWIGDQAAYVPSHGDLHFGNIGTYPSENGFGEISFGMVDFDEAVSLPFQLEILQGMITLELVASQNKITLSDHQRTQLLDRLCENYLSGLQSTKNATELLQSESLVAELLKKSQSKKYSSELDKFTVNDQFRKLVKKKQVITDLLERVDESRYPDFAKAIRQAMDNSDRLKTLMGNPTVSDIRCKIKSVALRHRLDSSGSQGLEKYLVLLNKPFAGMDHDIILYLKQEIPCAAERSGAVAKQVQSPAQRVVDNMNMLTNPAAIFSSYGLMNGKSFWITLKEPWSDEIDYEAIDSIALLEQAAKIWGTVAGTAQQQRSNQSVLTGKFTENIKQTILHRSSEYAAYQSSLFTAFSQDSRVADQIKRADTLIEGISDRSDIP